MTTTVAAELPPRHLARRAVIEHVARDHQRLRAELARDLGRAVSGRRVDDEDARV
jgi:hypothetical protein